MPFAIVHVAKLPNLGEEYDQLREALQSLRTIIAESLTCDDEGGGLVPSDVEVKIRPAHHLDISDYDIEVEVEAMKFPSRLSSRKVRSRRIYNQFVTLLPPCYKNPSLWIKWVDAEFVDSTNCSDEYS
jgi:hypothetical protein